LQKRNAHAHVHHIHAAGGLNANNNHRAPPPRDAAQPQAPPQQERYSSLLLLSGLIFVKTEVMINYLFSIVFESGENQNDLGREGAGGAGGEAELRRRNIGGEEGEPAGGDERGQNNPNQSEQENGILAEGAAGGPGGANYREVAWTFLTTFFTSLIPETYQHHN
jgi:hypothetical protein